MNFTVYKNETPIIPINIANIASTARIPVVSNNKNKKTSPAVTRIAAHIGNLFFCQMVALIDYFLNYS